MRRYLVLLTTLVGLAPGTGFAYVRIKGIGYGVTTGQNPGWVWHGGSLFEFSPNGHLGFYTSGNYPFNDLFDDSKVRYVHYGEAGFSLILCRDIIFGVGITGRFQGFNHVAQVSIISDILTLTPYNPLVGFMTSLATLSGWVWDIAEHFNKRDRLSLKLGGPSIFVETGIFGLDDLKLGIGASRTQYKGETHINGRISLYYFH